MPNRILKESICTSDSIDSLKWFDEVLFYRLIVNCDDYGRFDGRMSVIKSRLFPLKNDLTAKNISDGISSLVSKGLVVLYEFEGKPFLYLPGWDHHQQVRSKKSKYPDPMQIDIICNQMIADDSICSRNPIRIQSESESGSNAPACDKPLRVFGKFNNVRLSDTERKELERLYGESCAAALIENFSQKMAGKGYQYKDHYAAILSWAQKDGVKRADEKSYDLDDFLEAAVKRSKEELNGVQLPEKP